MPFKLTNEKILDKLLQYNIIMLNDYINSHISRDFQCNQCLYIWSAKPYHILNGHSGCPNCSNKAKLTNEIIDIKLINRNIKRLDNIINNKIKIKFQCININCNYIWLSSPNNILTGRGCPQCSNKIRLTNEILDLKIIEKNIKRLENVINNHNLITFQCLINNCNHIWLAAPKSIYSKNTGCPKCANNLKLTNKDLDDRLLYRQILRLDNYINSKIPIKFKCLIEKCECIWEAAPTDILSGKGCPLCKHKNEKLIYSILQNNNLNFEYHKSIQDINIIYPNYIVDFYFPLINTIIEYNGEQHYKPVRFGGIAEERAIINFKAQQKRDFILNEICQKYNINLICIDGRIFKGQKLQNEIIRIINLLKNIF